VQVTVGWLWLAFPPPLAWSKAAPVCKRYTAGDLPSP
jgi:hypothetical protein